MPVPVPELAPSIPMSFDEAFTVLLSTNKIISHSGEFVTKMGSYKSLKWTVWIVLFSDPTIFFSASCSTESPCHEQNDEKMDEK